MPPALWNEVVELAKDHGINATSRAFGLNATRIRVRMGSETDGTKVTPGAFMELSGAEVLAPDRSLTGGMHSVSSTGTEIELTSNHGNRLTIRLGSGQSLDFASLIRAFRD